MHKKTSISPAELRQLLDSDNDLLIVDVRSPLEFQEKHIQQAINIPMEEIEGGSFNPDAEQIVVTVCNGGGGRSERAALHLQQKGNIRSYYLEGGTLGWLKNEE